MENVIENLIEDIITNSIELHNNRIESSENSINSVNSIEKEKIVFIDGILILGGDNEKQVWKQSNNFFILNENFLKISLSPMIYGKCLFGMEKYLHYLFIFGGFNGQHCTNNIHRYNFLTNQWDDIGVLVEKRTGCISVLDEKNHKIYIMGGTQKRKIVCTIEEYDLISGISKEFIKSNYERTCGGAILYDENIYMFGGSKSKKDLHLEILNIKTKNFTIKENIIFNKTGIAYCFSFMDKLPCIFIVCGETFNYECKKKKNIYK